jgi:hypothetical protein
MNDTIKMLEQDKQRLVIRIEMLEAEVERIDRTNSDQTHELDYLRSENVRLQGEVDTCRELRKYDRIDIERMRILLDRAKS